MNDNRSDFVNKLECDLCRKSFDHLIYDGNLQTGNGVSYSALCAVCSIIVCQDCSESFWELDTRYRICSKCENDFHIPVASYSYDEQQKIKKAVLNSTYKCPVCSKKSPVENLFDNHRFCDRCHEIVCNNCVHLTKNNDVSGEQKQNLCSRCIFNLYEIEKRSIEQKKKRDRSCCCSCGEELQPDFWKKPDFVICDFCNQRFCRRCIKLISVKGRQYYKCSECRS